MSIVLERRLIAVGSFVVVPCGPSHLSGVASALRSRRGTGHRDHVQDRTCSGHMCEFSPGALSEARGGVGCGLGAVATRKGGNGCAHARTLTDAAMYLLGPLVPRSPPRQRVIQIHHLLFKSPWFEVCISEPVLCLCAWHRGASGGPPTAPLLRERPAG